MTCYIAFWKISVIHNIIVWMCYITCYKWFKSGALPQGKGTGFESFIGEVPLPAPPPNALARWFAANWAKRVYLLLIRQKGLNTHGASSISAKAHSAPGKNTRTKRQLQFCRVTAKNVFWTQQGYWWHRMAQVTYWAAGTCIGYIKGCQGGSKEPSLSVLLCISLALTLTFEKVPGMIEFWTPWFRSLYFDWFWVDPFDNSTSLNVEELYKIFI